MLRNIHSTDQMVGNNKVLNQTIIKAAQNCDQTVLQNTQFEIKPVENDIISYVLDSNNSSELKIAAIGILIQKGAKYTHYFLDSEKLQIPILKILIASGADINISVHGRNALFTAFFMKNRRDIITYLAESGINPNLIDEAEGYGNTILHSMIANESLDTTWMVQLFAKETVKLKIDYKIKDKDGKTPLIFAAKTLALSVVQEILKVDKTSINLKDHDGATALHYACAYGQVEMVRLLIASGADINAIDNEGNTPMHYATCSIEKIKELLFSVAIDPNRDKCAISNAFGPEKSGMLRFPEILFDNNIVIKTLYPSPGSSNHSNAPLVCYQNANFMRQFIAHNEHLFTPTQLAYMKKQLNSLRGRSIAEDCAINHFNVIVELVKAHHESAQNDAFRCNSKGKIPTLISSATYANFCYAKALYEKNKNEYGSNNYKSLKV